jgi:uncharacterized protein YbjT (DUF2867 family)
VKTLVLGGTGFVGRRLVEILTADDPLWGRTFDFGYEAEVAAAARGRLPSPKETS